MKIKATRKKKGGLVVAEYSSSQTQSTGKVEPAKKIGPVRKKLHVEDSWGRRHSSPRVVDATTPTGNRRQLP